MANVANMYDQGLSTVLGMMKEIFVLERSEFGKWLALAL